MQNNCHNGPLWEEMTGDQKVALKETARSYRIYNDKDWASYNGYMVREFRKKRYRRWKHVQKIMELRQNKS